ncbi:MAG: biotin/lipoyl-containing protein [Anaerolineales bacterium]|jgi:biotin carboxyl carrier protein
MKYISEVDGLEFPVEILDEHHVRFGGDVLSVDLAAVSGEPLYSLIVNGESYEGYVYPAEDGWQVLLLGQFYQVRVEDERERHLRISSQGATRSTAEFLVKAPMPGLIVSVPITEGEIVKKGQTLVILESMKMQNELRAPNAGKVARLRINAGDSVEQKQILLNLSAP